MSILAKTAALVAAYQDQETLNYVLKAIGTKVSKDVLQEAAPLPPLKKRVRFGKTELVLDEQDENYLLSLSRHRKRKSVAQLMLQNDTNTQDNAYRLIVANHPVDADNSEADLESYIIAISDDLAGVTLAEKNAVIPTDETL